MTHVVAPTIEIAALGGVPPVVPMRIMGDISLAVTELALAGWTLFATNVPSDRLTVREALMLGRARWHIELLFKL